MVIRSIEQSLFESFKEEVYGSHLHITLFKEEFSA
jgi:hypothetical protein